MPYANATSRTVRPFLKKPPRFAASYKKATNTEHARIANDLWSACSSALNEVLMRGFARLWMHILVLRLFYTCNFFPSLDWGRGSTSSATSGSLWRRSVSEPQNSNQARLSRNVLPEMAAEIFFWHNCRELKRMQNDDVFILLSKRSVIFSRDLSRPSCATPFLSAHRFASIAASAEINIHASRPDTAAA